MAVLKMSPETAKAPLTGVFGRMWLVPEEARRCDALLSGLDVASLPDGVTLEEARQVFQYARAGWRLWASQGRVLIEWGDV